MWQELEKIAKSFFDSNGNLNSKYDVVKIYDNDDRCKVNAVYNKKFREKEKLKIENVESENKRIKKHNDDVETYNKKQNGKKLKLKIEPLPFPNYHFEYREKPKKSESKKEGE